jgi:hypothetical protein
VREFLSQNGVPFEDRNIAQSGHWRDELRKRRGDVVVPVLYHRGLEVVGFDLPRLVQVLGLDGEPTPPEWDGLVPPAADAAALEDIPAPLAGRLRHLVLRIQKEMEYNAGKGSSPYRRGQHDGMRFARDALQRILDQTYQPEDPVVERPPSET